jgi:very-short-patch-repair endonuclease
VNVGKDLAAGQALALTRGQTDNAERRLWQHLRLRALSLKSVQFCNKQSSVLLHNT